MGGGTLKKYVIACGREELMNTEQRSPSMNRYDLQNRSQIPEDFPCCYNCKHIAWMVGIGQGIRCSEEKNEWRLFAGQKQKLKLPQIPGVGEKCEHFSQKYQ